jgi:hypothetical protein
MPPHRSEQVVKLTMCLPPESLRHVDKIIGEQQGNAPPPPSVYRGSPSPRELSPPAG